MRTTIHIFLSCIFIVLIKTSFSQCAPPTASTIINGNNVHARIGSGQGMWQDESNYNSAYLVPDGSGLSVFYAAGLWIGGRSEFNNLHVAATTYNSLGHDFFTGPLTTDGTADASNCQDYDRIFEISRSMVDTHISYFNSLANGTELQDFPFGYNIPQDILDYPAHGNTTLGEANDLAPYFDYNDDGYYTPDQGDCPLFSGMGVETNCASCDVLDGDIAFYWINNDKGNVHGQSGGQPFGVEIQNIAFAYQNPNAAPNKSTFYKKKIINRNNTNYHDVYVGLYVDVNIGIGNDFIGCDISRNLGYGYDVESINIITWNEPDVDTHPAGGVTILKGPKAVPNGIDDDNDGKVDNELLGMTNFMSLSNSAFGSNTLGSPQKYYNYLTSKWSDGTPLTYGGNGYSNNTNYPVNHIFPDDFILSGNELWTEITEENYVGDRRFLTSMGPFNMAAGEEICIVFAAVVGDVTNTMTAVENLKYKTDVIRYQFDQCLSSEVSVDEMSDLSENIIWDMASSQLLIKSSFNQEFELTVYNSLGQLVFMEKFIQQFENKMTNLKSGIYVVKLEDKKGSITAKKIVKS